MDDEALPIAVAAATVRKCLRCGIVRPLAMFYLELEARKAEKLDRPTFRMHCRICQRTVNDARRRDRQAYTDQVKLAAGCTDCGTRIPHPEVYDFDHLPGATKTASISALLTKGTFEDLLAEIAKCDVVCANCHRIRTRARTLPEDPADDDSLDDEL